MYFCLEQRLVTVRNQMIPLTVKEFEIFALLIQNPKRVFIYEMLLELVWHEDYTYYFRKAINNHISNLRKKIRITPDLPDYVKSVYGVGYTNWIYKKGSCREITTSVAFLLKFFSARRTRGRHRRWRSRGLGGLSLNKHFGRNNPAKIAKHVYVCIACQYAISY